MSRLLIASAFIASAVGFGERSIAADESGIFVPFSSQNCVRFLQGYKDEDAKRARAIQAEGGYYDIAYGASIIFISGYISGFNAAFTRVVNVFPGIEISTVAELVKKECDRNPKSTLVEAVNKVIMNNRNNWQLSVSNPK